MRDATLLVGDVGGTNARFALARMVDGHPRLEHFDSFPAETYPTFLEGVAAFIDGCEVKPTGGVIAVAGPVTDGAIDLTNSPWRVSEGELQTLKLNPIRDVIAHFRMPLADTMRGYWRWALKIADVADYDHTEAYEHLVKVIDRAVDTRTDRVDELVRFIDQCRTVA